jgi:NuA3 HAT complex component NTO1
MAPMPGTPRRSGAGRPRKSTTRSDFIDSTTIDETTVAEDTEQPRKKLRYIPGGPGGGGRYVDTADGSEILVGGTGPGGYNYVGPRGRIGRENAAAGLTPVTYPRGDRSTRTRTVAPRSRPPCPTFTSAAHAAATMSQNDGYKPREERGWEEFHPTLDIDGRLVTFTAAEVDGIPQTRPVTPGSAQATGGSLNGTQTPNGDIFGDPEDQTSPDHLQQDLSKITSIPGTPPTKRRPGRPPRDPAAFYAARAAAPAGGTPHTPRIAPLQNQHAKEKLTLPQPSYRKVDFIARFEDKASGLMRYVDKSMANIGYQETDIFQRPEDRLMKASDSTFDDDMDPENVGRVEYDMDEQDDYWLRDYNERRKAMDIEAITRELFEFTVTLIEKKWHALEKRIPKPNPKPPQTHRPRSSSAAAVNGEPGAGEEQDSKCAICDDGDCENTNAIVFCDGCDLAVHQECYGVPFIPEGQWLCRKCQLIGRGIPTCIFCPNTDGAFKQTNASKWAHLLCAMWIPEVSLGNHTFMEPVMDVEKVPKNRWKLNCYICNQKMGACIQCGNKQCFQAFHVTCARRGRLFLKMKNSQGQIVELDGQTVLKAFCDKHCPAEYARDNDVVQATREAKRFYKRTMRGRIWANSQSVAQAIAATHRNAVAEHPPDESQATGARLSLTLGDPKKKGTTPSKAVWKLPSGAPIIPAIVYDAVDALLQRFTIRKRKDYIAEVCRYWTLKREFRRGAPLIKRLQLQNETFSSMELTRRNFAGMGEVGRRRLERRIDFAEKLVNDLEKLKELADQTMERGKLEQEAIAVWAETINTVYFPVWKLLPPILDRAIT